MNRGKCPKDHLPINRHWPQEQLQELVETEEGSPHFVDFACVVCAVPLIRSENISNISRNAVWASAVEPAVSLDPIEREKFNPHKKTNMRSLRCRQCWNYLGYCLPEARSYRLTYISEDSGDNWMVICPPKGQSPNQIRDLLDKHTPKALRPDDEGRKAFAEPGQPFPRRGFRDEKGKLYRPQNTEKELLERIGMEPTPEGIEFVTKMLSSTTVRETIEQNIYAARIEKLQQEKEELLQEKEKILQEKEKLEQEKQQRSEAVVLKLNDLLEATEQLSVNKIVGRGGFGPVYSAEITIRGQKRRAAVKCWDNKGTQSQEEFFQEINILTNMVHPHLIPLLGHCVGKHNNEPLRALVYPFMEGGNLHDLLSAQEKRQTFDWKRRLDVALNMSDCIFYLHSLRPPVLHRDIKSANILLDGEGKAFLADLGLARTPDMTSEQLKTTQRQVGTPGYIDPDYSDSGRYSAASDIYSFGVVLLELLTGEQPQDRDKTPPGLARRALTKKLEADFMAGWPEETRERFFRVAISCVGESISRPTAKGLLELLRELRTPQEQKRERECVICMDAPPEGRFWPCHHAVVCSDCSEGLWNCPLCDAAVHRFERGDFQATFCG